MKTKVERNLRVLKAAAIVGVVILLLYILLLVFAPHQLERLEGELDTEHMENLYAIYGIRCENAFHMMTLLQLIKQRELLGKTIETFRQSAGQKEDIDKD